MSLIADALKAAQKEKTTRAGGADAALRARSLLGGVPPAAADAGIAGWRVRVPFRVPRSVAIAGSVFAAAVITAGIILLLLPEPQVARPAAPPSDAAELAALEQKLDTAAESASAGAAPESPAEAQTEAPPPAIESGSPPTEQPAAGRFALGERTKAVVGQAEGAARRRAGEQEQETTPGERPSIVFQAPPGAETPAPIRKASPVAEPAAEELAAAFAPAPARQPATERSSRFRLSVQQPQQGLARIFEEAVAAQKRGELARAAELYQQALALDPRNPELYNNLGAVQRASGDLPGARDAYRRALSLNPGYAAAWSNLGVVLDALGSAGEARAAYQEAIRLDARNTGARVNLALQYHASGLLGDAANLLRAALKLDPALAEAHYALARVLEDQDDRAGAVRHYTLFLGTAGGRFPQLEARVRRHLESLGGA